MDPPCFLLSSPPSNPKTQEKSPNRPPTPLSLIFSFLSFFILPLLFPSFSFLHPPNHHTHDDCYSHHQWCHCLRATTSQQSPSTSAITPLPLATSYLLLSLSLSLSHHTHDSHTTTPPWAPPSPSMVKLTTSGYCHFDADNTISRPWHPFLPLLFQKFKKWYVFSSFFLYIFTMHCLETHVLFIGLWILFIGFEDIGLAC